MYTSKILPADNTQWLTECWRMNIHLLHLPNKHIYQNKLTTGKVEDYQTSMCPFDISMWQPLIQIFKDNTELWNCSGLLDILQDLFNPLYNILILRLLDQVNADDERNEMELFGLLAYCIYTCTLTEYQEYFVDQLFLQKVAHNDRRVLLDSILSQYTALPSTLLTKTIDKSQGLERDGTMFSYTRYNTNHQNSNMFDVKKLNVATTRSKNKIIVTVNTIMENQFHAWNTPDTERGWEYIQSIIHDLRDETKIIQRYAADIKYVEWTMIKQYFKKPTINSDSDNIELL